MLSSSKWRSKEKILVGHNEGLNETDILENHMVRVFKIQWKEQKEPGRR